jgi:hypothetical protein
VYSYYIRARACIRLCSGSKTSIIYSHEPNRTTW